MARMKKRRGDGFIWPVGLEWRGCQGLRASHRYGLVHPAVEVNNKKSLLYSKEGRMGRAVPAPAKFQAPVQGPANSTKTASGAGFLLIAPESGDLIAKLLGTLLIPTGQGDRQGKLQLLQLMLPFRVGIRRIGSGLTANRGSTPTIGSGTRGGGAVSGRGKGHGWLSFYFDTLRQSVGGLHQAASSSSSPSSSSSAEKAGSSSSSGSSVWDGTT